MSNGGGGGGGGGGQNTRIDESIMNTGIQIGLQGIPGLLSIAQNGTKEMKNLLNNECDFILECKICRNLFRSVPNFISHKRTYCRASAGEQFRQQFLSLLSDNTTTTTSPQIPSTGDEQGNDQELKRPASTGSCPNTETSGVETIQLPVTNRNSASASTSGSNRNTNNGKGSNASKITFNLLKGLTKRIDAVVAQNATNGNTTSIPMHSLPPITKPVPFTTFENGIQVIKNHSAIVEKLTSKEPPNLIQNSDEPEATITMVLPQDAAYRPHGMELRTRRHPDSSAGVKDITKRDQELYERLASKCAQRCDLVTLQCLICKANFKVIDQLAFHLTNSHSDEPVGGNFTCYLCGIETDEISNHTKNVHPTFSIIYEEINSKKKSTSSTISSNVESNDSMPSIIPEPMVIAQNNESISIDHQSSEINIDTNETNLSTGQNELDAFVASVSMTATSKQPRVKKDRKKKNPTVNKSSSEQEKSIDSTVAALILSSISMDPVGPKMSTDELKTIKKSKRIPPKKVETDEEFLRRIEGTPPPPPSPKLNSSDPISNQLDSPPILTSILDEPKTVAVANKNISKEDEEQEEPQEISRPPSSTSNETITIVPRTMRKRTLKSPYDSAEFVNSWPRCNVKRTKPNSPSKVTIDEPKSPIPISQSPPIPIDPDALLFPRTPSVFLLPKVKRRYIRKAPKKSAEKKSPRSKSTEKISTSSLIDEVCDAALGRVKKSRAHAQQLALEAERKAELDRMLDEVLANSEASTSATNVEPKILTKEEMLVQKMVSTNLRDPKFRRRSLVSAV